MPITRAQSKQLTTTNEAQPTTHQATHQRADDQTQDDDLAVSSIYTCYFIPSKSLASLKLLLDDSQNFMFSIFLVHLKLSFGIETSRIFVELSKLMRQRTIANEQLRFLLKCRTFDVIPSHISNRTKTLSKIFFHSKFAKKRNTDNLISIQKKLLNLEITDVNIHIKFLTKEMQRTVEETDRTLRSDLTKKFMKAFELTLENLKTKVRVLHERKFNNLITPNEHVIIPNHESTPQSQNGLQNQNTMNESEPRKKWLVNLTGIDIPKPVFDILSLGEKFNFISELDKRTFFCFLKNLEQTFDSYEDLDNRLRNKILTHLNKYNNQKRHIPIQDRILSHKLFQTKEFLKENREILVTRADKGNITVMIPKDEYISKVETCLNNEEHYVKVKKSPLPQLQKTVTNLIDDWIQKGINDSDSSFKYLKRDVSRTNIARAYGLVKAHKTGFPVRIIVSAINSPTYRLDKCLSLLFNKHIPPPQSRIKNSYEMKKIIDKLIVPEDFELVSFDVVSLFTNLPHDLIIEALKSKWKYLKNTLGRCMSKSQFLSDIRILLSSTYLQFNGKFYRQKMGTPMGGCMSPILAEITLELLELKCLNSIKNDVILYKRYVDDCFLIVSKTKVQKCLEIFNSYDPNIQFTYEKETDGSLSFLDIQVTRRTNNTCLTNWFRKPTASGRYINFYSHHPIAQKIAIVYNLVDKSVRLSDRSFHASNIEIIRNFLHLNDYPEKFTDKYIKKRLHFIQRKEQNTPKNSNKDLIRLPKFVFPFVKGLSSPINRTLKRFSMLPVNINYNKFDCFIKLGKDQLPKYQRHNIVYKIDCNDCEKTYIGTSKRKLKVRTDEHKRDIRKGSETTALSIHAKESKHNFNFENVHIVDTENRFQSRLFSEMLNIYYYPSTLNKKEDINNLRNNYKYAIDQFKTSLTRRQESAYHS